MVHFLVGIFVFFYRRYRFNNAWIGVSIFPQIMMDVEQNRSSENKQVLMVFDGLLPMVCSSFFIVILCGYAVFCINLCVISKWTCFGPHSVILIIFRNTTMTLNRISTLRALQTTWKVISPMRDTYMRDTHIRDTILDWWTLWLFLY